MNFCLSVTADVDFSLALLSDTTRTAVGPILALGMWAAVVAVSNPPVRSILHVEHPHFLVFLFSRVPIFHIDYATRHATPRAAQRSLTRVPSILRIIAPLYLSQYCLVLLYQFSRNIGSR